MRLEGVASGQQRSQQRHCLLLHSQIHIHCDQFFPIYMGTAMPLTQPDRAPLTFPTYWQLFPVYSSDRKNCLHIQSRLNLCSSAPLCLDVNTAPKSRTDKRSSGNSRRTGSMARAFHKQSSNPGGRSITQSSSDPPERLASQMARAWQSFSANLPTNGLVIRNHSSPPFNKRNQTGT